MKDFVKIFKKVNGWRIVKDYIRTGYIFYAINHVILNGFSRKSLELLRLGIWLKQYNKIKRHYLTVLRKLERNYSFNQKESQSNKIWVCWFQGIENAPNIVQICYESIRKNLTNKEIILITDYNRKNYIQLPDYIEEKYAKGIISKTHLSDILRLALLAEYGGTWIDATVFCTSKNIPEYMLNSDFFIFQNLKPGSDGHILNISSWFITSKPNHKFILLTRDLLYEYWKKNNKILDYYIIHLFFSLTKEYYNKEWNKIVPFSNSTPHLLLLRLFEEYDNKCYNEIIRQTPFHKLTYKYSDEYTSKKGTYYDIIFNKRQSI